MSGKKVFTHAGELLANFFSTKRKIDIKANKQEEILNYIGKTENLTNIEVDIKEFEKQYELTKTQALTEIDNSIHKKFFNYKITDGVKEIPVNEMVQRMYHELKNLDATAQAQFRAVTGFMSIKMADQIKNTQEYYRQLSYDIRKGDESTRQYVDDRIDSTRQYIDGEIAKIPIIDESLFVKNKDFTQSLGSNGWTKLPNGLIMQWGSFKPSASSTSVTFPVSFPTKCLTLILQDVHVGDTSGLDVTVCISAIPTKTSFATSQKSTRDEIYWFAVGY